MVSNLVTQKDEEVLRAGRVVVRFAGDSGDGIQLIGGQFSQSTAHKRHDLITLSDFPAEIRAPKGTLAGVSAFQIQFGGPIILTVGDQVDVLVAFNPAALKVNLSTLREGGLIIVDVDSFSPRDLAKAGYAENPLKDGTIKHAQILEVPLQRLSREAATGAGVKKKEANRTKNFWAMGLVFWLFDRDRNDVTNWITDKFASKSQMVAANIAALNAGHTYGEVSEIADYRIPIPNQAEFHEGTYRSTTGIDSLVYGLAASAIASGRELCFCSYPITPATGILHGLTKLRSATIRTFQAEDEMAAVCAALGAAYAGALGVTASSGPGIALKAEAIGLAVSVELPLLVINVQRAGPSTGMPTKTEQADLNMALYGRHGEAPIIVLAPATPSECFEMAVEAIRLAVTYMTPVMLLLDGYIANASEPWRIPDVSAIPPIGTAVVDSLGESFLPFSRDPQTLARPWVAPGTLGFEHRIGGIERSDGEGDICYEPDNHQRMSDYRAAKIARAANSIAEIKVERGSNKGALAIVSWGSTYGPANATVNELIKQGHAVSHIQIRHLSPLPRGLEALLRQFEQVLVVELNNGQLRRLIRAEFLLPAHGANQLSGKPFSIEAIKKAAIMLLEA